MNTFILSNQRERPSVSDKTDAGIISIRADWDLRFSGLEESKIMQDSKSGAVISISVFRLL